MTPAAPRNWEEVRAEVLRRIRDRAWKPGELLPTEEALAREFGCARATVNRAMRELAASGLIERRRKAGTRVAVNPVRKATLAIPVIRLEVEASGRSHSHVLLSGARDPAPPAIAARLGLAAGGALLHLRTLHLADGRPHLLEDRWLNEQAVPEFAGADPHSQSVNEWLVRNVSYTAGDICFYAANAGPDEAEHLQCERGAALFVVERTTWREGTGLTAVRLSHAPGYRMQTVL